MIEREVKVKSEPGDRAVVFRQADSDGRLWVRLENADGDGEVPASREELEEALTWLLAEQPA